MEEKNMINLTIDKHEVCVPAGTMLLDAAKTVGISIPTLCHIDLEGTCVQNMPASCRICVVEIEGRRNLAPACATRVTPGMVVHTNSARVIRARKTVAELMLSDHPNDCLTCPKCSDCELQRLVMRFNIRQMPYNGGEQSERKQELTPAISRNMEKCVYCRRCESVCNNVQSVGVLSAIRRGFNTTIAPTFDKMFTDTNCTYCGQCVAVCPTGALTEHDYTNQLMDDLTNPDKVVDYAFDTDFAADLTIMEEGTEILQRLNKFLAGDKDVKLPIMTSCCPAWVNFYEHEFPDLLDYPSTAKSPAQMFGAIAKTYWAEKMGIPREKLVVVSIMPCLAKKYEAGREEFKVDGNPDVDYSISTRELGRLIKRANIDFANLPESDFDSPLGESTGAGVIFGITGGVMEAALRTVYEVHTGKTLPHLEFNEVRGFEGIKEATIDLNGFELKVCVAHTLSNARKVMNALRAGKLNYHVVEVMACPGGCIGGAGQPYHHGNIEILKARAAAVYREDEGKALRKSHENPDIQKLYKEFLGEPCGEKSHHLLHTHYFDKSIH